MKALWLFALFVLSVLLGFPVHAYPFGLARTVDSYTGSSPDAYAVGSVYPCGGNVFLNRCEIGQTFTVPTDSNYAILTARFMLEVQLGAGNPTGDIVAVLYTVTGTYGVNAVPIGPDIAISRPISTARLSSIPQVYTFKFPLDQQFVMTAGSHYAIAIRATSPVIDGRNYFSVHLNSVFGYANPAHSGNYFENISGRYDSDFQRDTYFVVTGFAVG